jgi:3-oxoacyl-[acyl-carrier protein] reductase
MDHRKIALVTGAGKGIGAAIAIELSKNGFDIWLNYRSDDAAAAKTAELIEAQGAACRLLKFDVANEGAVQENLGPLLEEETPYALVNNAGFARDALMIWMNREEWNGVLDVSLNGFFFVTKPVLNNMLKKRKGRIITIVSTSGQSGMPGQVNYSAAKAGLIGATRSLAAEVAKRNVLVNAVSPGFIATEMVENLPKERILPMIPMGKIGKPEDVAYMVEFLCSDKAAYITGQVFNVNGGVFM